MTALDRPLNVAVFADLPAATIQRQVMTLRHMAPMIQSSMGPSKSKLRLVKLATFGEHRSPKGSLRSDANMLSIDGIEADYDLEIMQPAQAIERLTAAGIAALVYDTPSSTPDTPRWRILCPFSQALTAESPEMLGKLRARYVGVVHAALGAVTAGTPILAAESFTASQAFYIGRVNGTPARAVQLIEGDCLDLVTGIEPVYRVETMPTVILPKLAASATSSDAASSALAACVAAFEDPVALATGRHQVILATTKKLAPFVVAGDLDAGCVVEAIEAACAASGRTPDDGEVEKALTGALPDAEAYSGAAYDAEPEPIAAEGAPRTTGPVGSPGNHKFADDVDGVALGFVRAHRDDLRYCAEAGLWYRWDGQIWRTDRTRFVFDAARTFAREWAKEPHISDPTRKEFSKPAFADGVERYAKADRGMVLALDAMDTDPFLLGTPGGTVDLKTGVLMRARPEDYITLSSAITPSQTVACPTWLAFLQQATGGDDDLISFLQKFAGYCLTGDTRLHALLFVHGPGGNGKSVWLNTLAGIMADYAKTAAMDTLTEQRGNRHPTDLAMLRGARLVTASETEEGRPWAEARIKALTGGDPITAHFMRQDDFTYLPTFKLVIVGNHKPSLHNIDAAAKRRFNIVPFTHTPCAPDRQLEQKLRAEWPGILRWMIDGCVAWQRDGLEQPQTVREATADYFTEQDTVAGWLDTACELGGRDLSATAGELFNSYSAYARGVGERQKSAKWLADALARHGCESVKRLPGDPNARGFRKIRLVPDAGELDAILIDDELAAMLN